MKLQGKARSQLLQRQRLEDYEFEVSLDLIARPCLKTNKQIRQQEKDSGRYDLFCYLKDFQVTETFSCTWRSH
jgi:hypothetical protein